MRMTKHLVLGAAAFIWIVIKLPQEYWIHVAQLDTTDLIKEDIFGVPTDTAWSEIVSDNIGVFIALGVALVLIGYGAWWYMTHKLPAADWPITFDVDAHQDDLTPEQVHAARARANRIFDRRGKRVAGPPRYRLGLHSARISRNGSPQRRSGARLLLAAAGR
jgi:hypothetical protein